MKKLFIFGLLFSLPLLAAFNFFSPEEFTQTRPAAYEDSSASLVISDEEARNLSYMREEEKLAHDVYIILYKRWGLDTFNKIAGSELAHSEAVANLLEHYGVADPAANLEAGRFSDPNLQALYSRLIEQGSQSLGEALKVGAAIEEIDIQDLNEALLHTKQADIQQVYTNLRQGSYNHLRAYSGTWERLTGKTFQPQYLSNEEYEVILSGGNTQGAGGPMRGNNQRGRGNPNH